MLDRLPVISLIRCLHRLLDCSVGLQKGAIDGNKGLISSKVLDSMEMILELSVVVGLVAGLIEAIKRAGMPGKVLPFLSVALGVGAMYLTKFSPNHAEMVMYGLMVGLGAVGLFEVGKQGTKVAKGE